MTSKIFFNSSRVLFVIHHVDLGNSLSFFKKIISNYNVFLSFAFSLELDCASSCFFSCRIVLNSFTPGTIWAYFMWDLIGGTPDSGKKGRKPQINVFHFSLQIVFVNQAYLMEYCSAKYFLPFSFFLSYVFNITIFILLSFFL